MIWHANNLFGSAMWQNLPVSRPKKIRKNISQLITYFIKMYDKDRITRYLLEVDINYPKT